MAAIAVGVCSCVGPRRIDLDSALRSTQQGNYTLIVFTDTMVSFQGSNFHKYQYYFTPPLPRSVIDQIKAAMVEGKTKKRDIHIMDCRNGSPNDIMED